jgi:hypothetical protein
VHGVVGAGEGVATRLEVDIKGCEMLIVVRGNTAGPGRHSSSSLMNREHKSRGAIQPCLRKKRRLSGSGR